MIYTDGLVSLFAFAEFMPRAPSAGTPSRSAASVFCWRIAGTFGAWLGGSSTTSLVRNA